MEPIKLIAALENGFALSKRVHKTDDTKLYVFLDKMSSYRMIEKHGYGSDLYETGELLLEIIERSDLWEIDLHQSVRPWSYAQKSNNYEISCAKRLLITN